MSDRIFEGVRAFSIRGFRGSSEKTFYLYFSGRNLFSEEIAFSEVFLSTRSGRARRNWCQQQTLPGGADTNDEATDASAVFNNCDRIDETVNKLAEHEDARRAPVEISAPQPHLDAEGDLRC